MKAVNDTNVVLSGLFFKGAPREVYLAWVDKAFVAILTSGIIDEYRRAALAFLGKHGDPDVDEALQLIVVNSILIDAPPLPMPICRDPDEDKFIACALHGRAECIVSGDKDLRVLKDRIAVDVMGPREFLQRIQGT